MAPLRHDVSRAPLAQDRRGNGAGLVDREDDDRDAVVARKSESRSVHYLQLAGDRLVMSEAIEACGCWILLRVGGIDAVDLSGLHHRVAGEFGGPKRGACVGGEERITGPTGEDDDPMLDQVRERGLARIGLT